MTKVVDPDNIDPTLDDFCYLISLVLKEVNPAINREVAHDMLLEMVEAHMLTEPDAVEIGRMIRATAQFQDKEQLH